MSSGKNSGFGEFWDKNETKYYDVGLGLRLQQQHQQQQQQQQNHVYSSSGGELTRVVPFTPNQRQELERQTVIYKYMMASMPVPPELIIPLSKYPPQPQPQPQLPPSTATRKAAGEVRYHHGIGRGAGGDPEPWRCRRTDGKKWRCSRDVAPDQKYCERHSHKGRPSTRSRKPVESSLIASATSTTNVSTTTTTMSGKSIALNPFQQHPSSFDLQSSFRYPEWFTKEEVTVPPSAQVLYPEQMEQFSHSHTSEFTPESDRATRPLSRPFIDAWSLEDVHKNKCPNTSSSMSTILPLTLSMSAGFDLDNGQNNPKDDEHSMREIRSSHQQPLNWMSSWSNMPSGGPLAEALCLGMSGTNNTWGSHSEELVSPHGHSSGSTGTTMSSKGSHASGDNIGQGFHLQ